MSLTYKKAASISGLILALQLGYGQNRILDFKKDFELRMDTLIKKIEVKPQYTNSIMFQTDLLSIHQKSLGIFCKAEDKISAKTPVQFRFRLGGLDYVNKLEGK